MSAFESIDTSRQATSLNSGTANEVDKIHNAYNGILFTLLGTIQGLALTALAEKIPVDNIDNISTANYYNVAHFIACFFIVARITQTYISAALTYVRSKFTAIDLFSVLAIGMLEYTIIKFSSNKGIDTGFFHLSIMILALVAIASHGRTAISEIKDGTISYRIDMQIINIFLSFLIVLFCTAALFESNLAVKAVISASVAIFLLLNIMILIKNTAPIGMPIEVLFK